MKGWWGHGSIQWWACWRISDDTDDAEHRRSTVEEYTLVTIWHYPIMVKIRMSYLSNTPLLRKLTEELARSLARRGLQHYIWGIKPEKNLYVH